MAISLRNLIFALLVCTLRLDLMAQADFTPVRTTLVRFYYHSRIGLDPSSKHAEPSLKVNLDIGKNKSSFINLDANNSSKDLIYTGEGPLELYKMNKTEQGTIRNIIATVPLPAGLKGVLYFVVYDGGKYHFTPIPFSADGIPRNHVKILNLCPAPLAVKFASSQNIVLAKDETIMDISAADKILEIKVARKIDDQWKMDVDVVLLSPERDERCFFLLLPDSLSFNRVMMLPMGPMPGSVDSTLELAKK